ncbi:MAG TPA: SgcJ/EcaC family oxidoreductase [Streptosporangiaceae bacterium]|jgi:uncharacterized protein (TIGR02246 family)
MSGMTGDAPTARDTSSAGAGPVAGAGAGRPVLGDGGVATEDAAVAVAALVAELQEGWDTHDADLTNRHFAADLLWGSPFGAVLQGYEPLHQIHVRLKQEGRGGPASRYEVAAILSPAPDVIVTQVRRMALGPDGEPCGPRPPAADASGPFSEMALYVLVRRDGQWWLAAGQNTLVLPPPA